ncbi:hypothetical protein D9M71_682940 [compost metagenome]
MHDVIPVANAHRHMFLGGSRHLLDDRPQHARQHGRIDIGLADAQGLGGQPVEAPIGLREIVMHQRQQKTPGGALGHVGHARHLGHTQTRMFLGKQL